MDDVPWLRVGYVSPHPLVDTLTYEFHLLAPPGVMMMATFIEIENYTTEAVERQLALLDARIGTLLGRGAGRVVISGVPIAIGLGRSRTRALVDGISDRTGVPADTDLEAIIAGALHLGVETVGLATRWKAPMNDRLAAYLDEAGLRVVEVASSGRSMAENAGLDDATGMQLAAELGTQAFEGRGAPDAVIMPGGRWITVAAVRKLEERFGRPVITNYAAGLWAALRGAGWSGPMTGRGLLLRSLESPA